VFASDNRGLLDAVGIETHRGRAPTPVSAPEKR